MKSVSVIIFVLGFVVSSYQQHGPRKFIKECVDETGVDKEVARKSFREGEFPDDKNLKCFLKCIHQKAGEITEDGKIDFSHLLDHLPPNVDKDKINEVTTKCSQLEADDDCELAFEVAKCMREAHALMHHH